MRAFIISALIVVQICHIVLAQSLEANPSPTSSEAKINSEIPVNPKISPLETKNTASLSKPAALPPTTSEDDTKLIEQVVLSEISKPKEEETDELIAQESVPVPAVAEITNELHSAAPSTYPLPIPNSEDAPKPTIRKQLKAETPKDTLGNFGEGSKGKPIHIISAIPTNPITVPHHQPAILQGAQHHGHHSGHHESGGGLEGYTYGGAGGSAEVSLDDKLEGQTFGFVEGASNLSPELTGAAGQFSVGTGASLNTGPISASFGISSGGTSSLGYSPDNSDKPNIFTFLQQLPKPFGSITVTGTGGISKPGGGGSSHHSGHGHGAPEKADGSKEDPPKKPESTGLFGFLTPFSSFSSAILDDSDESGSVEKNEEGGGGGGGLSFADLASGGLTGFFKPLTSLTGMTEGSVTIGGGASVKPFLPVLNTNLCQDALHVCILACRDVGKTGGVLTQGNRCQCSCPAPERLTGGNLCSNKFTSHCNKFCKTNLHVSYESGHCNSVSGDCECKAPLGKSCFGSSSHHSPSASAASPSHHSPSASAVSPSHHAPAAAAAVPSHVAPAASAAAPSHVAPAAAAGSHRPPTTEVAVDPVSPAVSAAVAPGEQSPAAAVVSGHGPSGSRPPAQTTAVTQGTAPAAPHRPSHAKPTQP